ncbi:MAG: hypothetical protein LBP75_10355 [Planctomycetota bacterium]|nr:hypothetical protein [Planctomycetota bacterium]
MKVVSRNFDNLFRQSPCKGGIYQPRVSGDALSTAPPWVKTAHQRHPQLDVSPRFGETLSPPEAAFAAANRAGGTVGWFASRTATQGGATIERVAYPGLIYVALSARLAEFDFLSGI